MFLKFSKILEYYIKAFLVVLVYDVFTLLFILMNPFHKNIVMFFLGFLVEILKFDYDPSFCRPEDLRVHFEHFGPLRDVYLPKNYYTGYVMLLAPLLCSGLICFSRLWSFFWSSG